MYGSIIKLCDVKFRREFSFRFRDLYFFWFIVIILYNRVCVCRFIFY